MTRPASPTPTGTTHPHPWDRAARTRPRPPNAAGPHGLAPTCSALGRPSAAGADARPPGQTGARPLAPCKPPQPPSTPACPTRWVPAPELVPGRHAGPPPSSLPAGGHLIPGGSRGWPHAAHPIPRHGAGSERVGSGHPAPNPRVRGRALPPRPEWSRRGPRGWGAGRGPRGSAKPAVRPPGPRLCPEPSGGPGVA